MVFFFKFWNPFKQIVQLINLGSQKNHFFYSDYDGKTVAADKKKTFETREK